MSTRKPDPEDTLKAHMRVQRSSDVDVKKILRENATELSKEVKALGQTPEGARARMTLGATHERLEELFRQVENATAANKEAAAAAAIRAFQPYEAFFKTQVPGGFTKLVEGFTETARLNIAQAEMRMLGTSYHTLSENVYRSRALSQGWVDRYLDRALAKGLTQAEIADGLKKMIRPDVPGGVSYAALRTARTEVNNSFHAVSIARYKQEGVTAVDWNLSESHPLPDECDEYALEIWPIDRVPRKPHPMCFCYITPSLPSEEDFIAGLLEEL